MAYYDVYSVCNNFNANLTFLLRIEVDPKIIFLDELPDDAKIYRRDRKGDRSNVDFESIYKKNIARRRVRFWNALGARAMILKDLGKSMLDLIITSAQVYKFLLFGANMHYVVIFKARQRKKRGRKHCQIDILASARDSPVMHAEY